MHGRLQFTVTLARWDSAEETVFDVDEPSTCILAAMEWPA